MFTGIVEEVGTVVGVERPDGVAGGDVRRANLRITCEKVLRDAEIGSSIAVDGCCITVTDLDRTGEQTSFVADLMAETLDVTTLGELAPGSPVNLERPLAAGARFGGHIVQGHVDGVGTIVHLEEQPGTVLLTVTTADESRRASPDPIMTYLVAKGSVAVDGVSLTVVDVDDRTGSFRVGLVPHTREVTTLGTSAIGDLVNLEVDIVAKYVSRTLRMPGQPSGVWQAPQSDRGGGEVTRD